jgi:hypothetical protein
MEALGDDAGARPSFGEECGDADNTIRSRHIPDGPGRIGAALRPGATEMSENVTHPPYSAGATGKIRYFSVS